MLFKFHSETELLLDRTAVCDVDLAQIRTILSTQYVADGGTS